MRSRWFIILPAVVALAAAAAACAEGGGTASTTSPATTTTAAGVVAGRVLAGPVCPVEHDPPDPACEDRPVAGAVIVVTLPGGSPVARATADTDGRFSLTLPAGTYRFTPQPVQGLLGTAAPVDAKVQVGATIDLLFTYDTGIRGPAGG